MRNDRRQGRRRFRDELEHTIEEMGHDLERTADQVRRRVARELRSVGPTVVDASERLATSFWRSADNIDRSLRREGKTPSQPPPRNTRPGY